MHPRTKNAAADAILAKLESKVEEVNEPPPPTVGDVMTRDVASCRADDMVERSARIMWDRACGAVPVVDDDNRPIAMITDRDICMAAWIQGKPLDGISVASAMSKRLFAVDAHDSVAAAVAVMRRFNVRRLPVVDASGELVGILSVDDVTRHGRSGPMLGEDPFSPQVIAGTAAALAHPHARET